MDFDEFGNYQAGIHPVSLEWIKDHLVDEVKESTTRNRNLMSFIDFFKSNQMKQCAEAVTHVLVDGSFVTNKINPNDIDVLLVSEFTGESYEELVQFFVKLGAIQESFNLLKDKAYEFHSDIYFVPKIKYNSIKSILEIHSEFIRSYKEIDYQYKYWLGQFTFDREEKPKGIFKIEGSELNE